MITLATLKDATAQQVFDQVVTHMVKQNQRSVQQGSMCLYRGPGGLMCAAGCLIADDEYQETFDEGTARGGGTWSNLIRNGLVSDAHSDLITRLQMSHDRNSHMSKVIESMRNVGIGLGLNVSKVPADAS